jgi:hypothetical protein
MSAFFLFVPPLLIAIAWIATFTLLLTGSALLYCFGVQPGPRLVPAVATIDQKS